MAAGGQGTGLHPHSEEDFPNEGTSDLVLRGWAEVFPPQAQELPRIGDGRITVVILRQYKSLDGFRLSGGGNVMS